jgi:hypothetical protein
MRFPRHHCAVISGGRPRLLVILGARAFVDHGNRAATPPLAHDLYGFRPERNVQ